MARDDVARADELLAPSARGGLLTDRAAIIVGHQARQSSGGAIRGPGPMSDPNPTPFKPVPTQLDFPRYERDVLAFWKANEIFEKSTSLRGSGAPSFVFYEGPPTANGVPHNGHVLTRVMKDLFPRYQSMSGKQVLRKGGWDTHGLPVEVEVEKELRIHGKAAIEEYGVEPFVARCIESVFRYTSEWERLTERIGFWVSLPDAYVTYHRSYVESVWWALSELFKKGLLYQGHKVVWWWAQGGTALSSAEVGLGYKSVDDPSVFVLFPLVEEPSTSLVVWTTTPWTLPSNGYAAVRATYEYAICELGGPLSPKTQKRGGGGTPMSEPLTLAAERLIVAAELRAALEEKLGRQLVVIETVKGSTLVGKRYVPPFDCFYGHLKDATVALDSGGDEYQWWRVIAEDFVTLEAGTGIVHVAPAFGEDDNKAHKRQLTAYKDPDSVELLCAVEPSGVFSEAAGERYRGRWVKDADKDIIADLAARGILAHQELYRHDYPYCWRADDDPLIQLARPAWFIRTTQKLGDALANNESVNWLPEHIKKGRFGDFLENNVDWALSRERYWGTPLNVWRCEACEMMTAPASVSEIEGKSPAAFAHWHEAKRRDPSLNDHLIVHKPWIDQVTFPCDTCGATMRRVPEVIDCWFDSGCMPFAQWGFPHVAGSKERFDAAFPADFISEAIDQTRGWFYSLLMVSTLVFDEETQVRLGLSSRREYPLPYKTCIVLGHVCDREGKKESKSKGNYTPPEIILDRVRMDFGVLEQVAGVDVAPAEAVIAREDLDGMDLKDGARVVAYRSDAEGAQLELTLRASAKLPRRVVLLHERERAKLRVKQVSTGLRTMPVEVPRVPIEERVTLEDLTTPAPGADAFRWFFYAASPPWSNTRHSLRNVRTLQKDFHVKLRNVYSFFTIYANIDGWYPAQQALAGAAVPERSALDRWMMSELHLAIREVRSALDRYLVYEAAGHLVELVEGLSNWYVRRSRARFWAPGLDLDKRNAYATLHEALVTVARLAAPFIPFFSEELYQNLVVHAGHPGAKESVHLDDFPTASPACIDEELSRVMGAVREIVSLGLSVRTASRLKVRQPLSRADVVLNDGALRETLRPYEDLVVDELNVHELRLMHPGHEQGAVAYRLKPNFKTLGPKLGKRVQAVKRALEGASGAGLHAELSRAGNIRLSLDGEVVQLDAEDIEVQVEAAPGFAAETGKVGVVVLHTTLTGALIDEGLLRELVSRVQAERKAAQLDFVDRIRLCVDGSERMLRIAREHAAHVQGECLAAELRLGEAPASAAEHTLGEEVLRVHIERL